MNGASAAARVQTAIAIYGEAMTLKRRASTGGAFASYTVQGTVRHYLPGELVGQLKQGDAEVLLSTSGEAPRPGDQIVIQARAWAVQGVETIRLSGTAVAHKLWVRGG